jgi:halocyanin-like protein
VTDDGWTRRGVLAASAGAAATAAAAPAAAQSDAVDEWLSDAGNYDGSVTDMTGESSVTVEVGSDDGSFVFAPPAVRIDPGTTVTFDWLSDAHNVVVENQPDGAEWAGYEGLENTGFSFEHTFETEGEFLYFCSPHRSAGMKGAIIVGGDGGGGTPAPVGEPDYGGWFGGDVKGGAVGNYDGTVDRRGESSVAVEVGADGNGGTFAFAPAAVRVDPGTTVTFEWTSDNHNIVVEEQPGDAGWSGHEPIENTGFTYEHTFEAGGIYTYYCQPHLSVGMKAAVVVGDVGPSQAGPSVELGGLERTVLGLGVGAGLLAPVAFALAGRLASTRGVEPDPTVDADPVEPDEEIGHESFTPGGTWRLVLVYFAILVVMWVLTYFVEFLGNGPTVIG